MRARSARGSATSCCRTSSSAASRSSASATSAERDKPGLIYCSISGYDRRGPEAARPGYDLVIQGEAGLMAINGEADRPPLKFGVAAVDLFTGMYAAQAILAALFERERTGAAGTSRWRCSTAA